MVVGLEEDQASEDSEAPIKSVSSSEPASQHYEELQQRRQCSQAASVR